MRTIIAGLSRSPMPEPMPVVMNKIILIFFSRCRSLPQFEIERWWWGYFFSISNRFSVIGIPGCRKVWVSNRTVPYKFHSFNKCRHGAALITHLNMLTILGKCFSQKFTFIRILPAGLFHIYMLSMLNTHNGSWCMPMVRCRDDQGIEIFLFQQF